VVLECRPSTQVGGRVPAQPEETAPAKAGGRHWGNRRTQHRLYYRVIKIETPEASVSGVFNLSGPSGLACSAGLLTGGTEHVAPVS
jgi:hypothetical protein